MRQSIRDFEIIIVDDGSRDGTGQYITELEKSAGIIAVLKPNKGPAVARNAGIARARGTFIAFTDDDCIVPTDWLENFHAHLKDPKTGGIGGAAKTGDNSNLFAVANDMIVNFLKSELNGKYQFNPPFLTSNNTAYTKSCLESVGGFDEGYFIGAEERDLNYRLFLKGVRLKYDPDIVVEHYNDSGFTQFLKHQFDQGKGSRRFYNNILRENGKKPDMIPSAVYRKMFTHPFRVEKSGRAFMLFLLFILAQTAITAGYFSAVIKGTGSQSGNIPEHHT